MLLATARKWMSKLEEYPMGLAGWFVIFISIVFVRDIFEGFSGHIPFVHPIDYFIHYPLAFLNPILALSIVLAVFSGVNVLRITKLMLFVSAAVFLLPPLLDIVGSGIAGKEGGSHIGYLYLERSDYIDHIINFFNPFREFKGTTAGIRIEAFISCLLAFVYVLIRSGKLLRAVGAFIVIYFVSLAFFTYPYNWYHLFGGPGTEIEGVRRFFEGNGVVLRHFFDPQSFSFASLHILLLALLTTAWTAVWSLPFFFRILKRSISGRFLFCLFLASMGVSAAWKGFYPPGYDVSENLSLFDYVSFAQAALALMYLNLFRSSLVEFTGSGSSWNRLPREASVAVSAVSAALAIMMSMSLHYAAITVIMTMLGTVMLLHVKPLQLRRWPLAGAVIEGLFWILAWLFGFALLVRGEAPAMVDRRFASIAMATLTGFSLWRMGKGRIRTVCGEFTEDFSFLGVFDKVERLLPFAALPVAGLGSAYLFKSPWLAAAGVLACAASAMSRTGGGKLASAGRIALFPFLAVFLGLLFVSGLNNPGVMSMVAPSTGTERFHETFAHKLLWDGYPDHALLEYEAAVASGSKVLEMYTTLAFLYEQKNMPERPIRIAEIAVEVFPENPVAWRFLGDRLMLLDKFENAADAYSRATELQEPSPDSEILRKSGLAQELAGRHDAALDIFERAYELNPDDPGIAVAYWSLAFSNASEIPGKVENGKTFWQRVSTQSEDSDSLYLAARYLDSEGNLEDASGCYNRIERLFPAEIPVLYLHSRVCIRRDEMELAIDYMERVVERTGVFVQPVLELSMLLQLNGRPDAAAEALSAYWSGPGADIDRKGAVLVSLGLLKAEAGALDAAVEVLKEAFTDSTLEASVRSGTGARLAGIIKSLEGDPVLSLKTGKLSEICGHPVFDLVVADSVFGEAFARNLAEADKQSDAVCAYHRLTTAFPGYIRALFNYGRILEGLGRFDDALVLYERINNRKIDHPRAWFRRAICLVRLGKKQEGLESARFCLKISPGFKPAAKMIDALESGSYHSSDSGKAESVNRTE